MVVDSGLRLRIEVHIHLKATETSALPWRYGRHPATFVKFIHKGGTSTLRTISNFIARGE